MKILKTIKFIFYDVPKFCENAYKEKAELFAILLEKAYEEEKTSA